jgi:3-oxoacyl-[acyl-carrier-protein] synthase-3
VATYSRIVSVGSYLPERVVTNDDLAKIVDTSDEWIFSRTGMRERRIAAEGELTSDMAAAAAKRALGNAGIPASDIDLIVLATTTPDLGFPATACRVQRLIGAGRAAALDVQAVCTGFIYALSVADNAIRCGEAKRAIVIGADKMSRILDWTDRSTCVLFGDGAGAAVLEASEKPGIMSTVLHADGNEYDILKTENGLVKMDGQAVFKLAVSKLPEVAREAMAKAGVDAVDWFVPHQANARIIDAAMKHLDLPPERVVKTIGIQANTSAASLGVSLDMMASDKRLKRGDTVLLAAMGGGFTWGAAVFRY